MSGKLFVLVEVAAGYSLYEKLQVDAIAQDLPSVQQNTADYSLFAKMMRLVSFVPFKSAAHALENCMDVSEGIVNDHLKSFLELNLANGTHPSLLFDLLSSS